MSEYIKPPLGTAPHWFVLRGRIQELIEAMQRYIEFIAEAKPADNVHQYELIAQWAEEIKMLAEMEIKMQQNYSFK